MSDEFVHLLDSLFAEQYPVVVKSRGGSMRPLIPCNAAVKLQSLAPGDTVRLGEVVLFETKDGLTVIHRVVRRLSRGGVAYIQTWGDNVTMPDAPVPRVALRARVTAIQTGYEWQEMTGFRKTYCTFLIKRYLPYWLGRLPSASFRRLRETWQSMQSSQ